ncbi:MAG: 4-alpha-glucanotransferase, partial [Geminicoccaceae bacterium]
FAVLPEEAPRKAAFREFCRASGTALVDHARFEALAKYFSCSVPSMIDWRDWPKGYRTPAAPDVSAFAEAHADRVTFYIYLLWLVAEQLDGAQRSALDAGMALGLYRDLAVGVAPDGAEAWCHQDVLVEKARIGAPPDDFNPKGQNWGLLPFSPKALKAEAYRPFVKLIRSNMRSAGALRIDHVLGLARSFWQPESADIAGAYVRYPLNDLVGLVALESERNQCVVIGEDLGTVPETLRSALDERDLLGCRLLYFERDEAGTFRPAAVYPRNCIASIGTHDLPTLQGFWQGRDIETRAGLGLYPDEKGRRADLEERARQRNLLLLRLQAEHLLPAGIDPERPPEALSRDLVEAFHRFLGATPAMLKAVQLEDVVGTLEQANLPGTIDEYPNWRQKVGPPLQQLADDDRLAALLQAIAGR